MIKEQKAESMQTADVSSKRIFGNHTLCAQFLRDYSELPMLRNVQPEDIEDVSERYHLFKEVEHNADTVKKIHIKDRNDGTEGDTSIYLISLVEHKTAVDYNINMQILKYMVCIWENWEKEIEEAAKTQDVPVSDRKDFKYPPIFPIVYYEGSRKWTAATHLSERIFMSDLFRDYVPDFTYKLVSMRDISNETLLSNEDVISLLMMLNKIQKPEDFDDYKMISAEMVNKICRTSSPDVLEIIIETIYAFCRKMNLPDRETEKYISEMRGGNMGYLWENMEKMDIQQERRNTAEQKQRADEQEKRADEQKKRADDQEKRADEQEKRGDQFLRMLIRSYRDQGKTKEEIINLIVKESGEERERIERIVNEPEDKG